MREDNRNQLAEQLSEKLLDAALTNYRGAEPRSGLEERVLANLRQQPRTARTASWNLAPIMIVVTAVLTLFTVDHLIYHPAASDPAALAVSEAGKSLASVESKPAVLQTKAGERERVIDEVKPKKAAAVPKWASSSSDRQDLALNLTSRRADERADDGLRVEEVRIAEVRLDEIVISNNERQE